ncbi:MAG: nucleotide exchange factor GrpE [Thermaerobacter sp.]|nr:nucleotide exchange factor GrpE [Thermaerobacter sp.]
MSEKSRPEEEETLQEDAPQAAQSGEGEGAEALLLRIAELEQQNLRLLADFDNFRRRQSRAEQELRARAYEDAVAALLPLADDLERALQAAAEDDPLRAGVAMVERSLQGVLQRFGAQPIAALGLPFDPTLHEAVAEDESDLPPGTVTAELRRGYRIEDRVVRPAMVRVARARE